MDDNKKTYTCVALDPNIYSKTLIKEYGIVYTDIVNDLASKGYSEYRTERIIRKRDFATEKEMSDIAEVLTVLANKDNKGEKVNITIKDLE